MWEDMITAVQSIENSMNHADASLHRGASGLALSMLGMAGWVSTENVVWFIPIAISIAAAISNAITMHRFAAAKARFDLKLYKSVAARASGVELASLGPETPDPDL